MGDRDVLGQLKSLLPPSDEQLQAGLDPELTKQSDQEASEIDFKRNLVTSAAIQGLIHLYAIHKDEDYIEFHDALAAIGKNQAISAEVRQEALEAQQLLSRTDDP